jgi:hypothetical protein
VQQVTMEMWAELMETRRAEEAARPERNDPDTHTSVAEPAPGGLRPLTLKLHPWTLMKQLRPQQLHHKRQPLTYSIR